MKQILKPILYILILFVLVGLVFTNKSSAQTMKNDLFKLESGNLNPFSGKAENTQKSLTFSGGSLTGTYSGANYKVRAGFPYIESDTPFSFSISNTAINFGVLSPGEPITRTNVLSISTGSSSGYQITAQENNELKTSEASFIPDTTCDAGICTETTASEWTSPLVYGFGYRCDNLVGNGCDASFTSLSFYKQFANIEKDEDAQIVSSASGAETDIESQITYKINIPATQIPGQYQNSIIYIATPGI